MLDVRQDFKITHEETHKAKITKMIPCGYEIYVNKIRELKA